MRMKHREGLGRAQQPRKRLCRERGSPFVWTETEGLRARSELPAEIPVLLQEQGKSLEQRWAPPGQGAAKSRGSPRGSRREKRKLQRVCSGYRVGSTERSLQPVPSLLDTLTERFLPKNNRHPVSKALFPNTHTRVSGSGAPFSFYIFLEIDGGILSCLLIQTSNLNHSWFRSGQLPPFHSACSFPGKKLPPLGSPHFLYSPLITQLSILQFHYTRSFFGTCLLSITMNPYVVFKTSILTSSLFSKCLAL